MTSPAVSGLTGWLGVVLSGPDARALAQFYSALLGWPVVDDQPDWCTIRVPGARANLAFQSELDYVPPVWPAERGRQQMMVHLDIGVRDLNAAVVDAIALGAVEAAVQFEDDVCVLLDPAGHPFCLYVDSDDAEL